MAHEKFTDKQSKCCDGEESACPFAFTDASEFVQNLGCLPTPYEIVVMRRDHGKTWACHSNPRKPCAGALIHMRDAGMPYKVIDTVLVTEKDDWSPYTRERTAT